MEPFKHRIKTGTVELAGAHLQCAWPAFDRRRFEALANDGLEALELKARALHVTCALQATLPPRFAAAAEVLEAALAPPIPLDADGEPLALSGAELDQGLAGWVIWSLGEFVARQGQADVPRALACLHALTQRFTAEFSIRPFVRDHPALVFDTLMRWTQDPSAHVRRLVSEGSRPRLPWGLRLQALVADPTPTLPLLRALQDDPSAYVRRSVANHLNDIAKDHPQRVSDWVLAHRPGADARRTALLRHASRSLIKQGHGPTLDAWGLRSGLQGQATAHAVEPSGARGRYAGPARESRLDQHCTAGTGGGLRGASPARPGQHLGQGLQGLEAHAGSRRNPHSGQTAQPAPCDHTHALSRPAPGRAADQRSGGG